jgi:hypothetical protein
MLALIHAKKKPLDRREGQGAPRNDDDVHSASFGKPWLIRITGFCIVALRPPAGRITLVAIAAPPDPGDDGEHVLGSREDDFVYAHSSSTERPRAYMVRKGGPRISAGKYREFSSDSPAPEVRPLRKRRLSDEFPACGTGIFLPRTAKVGGANCERFAGETSRSVDVSWAAQSGRLSGRRARQLLTQSRRHACRNAQVIRRRGSLPAGAAAGLQYRNCSDRAIPRRRVLARAIRCR